MKADQPIKKRKRSSTQKSLLLVGSAFAASLVVCLLLVAWIVSQSYTINDLIIGFLDPTPSPQIEATPSALPPTSTTVPTALAASPTVAPDQLTHQEFLGVANEWTLLFSDDFDDNSGDWRDTDGVTDPKVNLSFEGRLKISISTEEDTISETFYREAVDVPDNFLLTVDAAAVDVDACEYGLVFRGDINQQYYLFAIRGNEGIFQIMNVNPSQGRQTIYSDQFPPEIELPSSLTVIGEADSYRFYINKMFVYEMVNDRLNGDRVGLETFLCPERQAEFIFDKFEVRQP